MTRLIDADAFIERMKPYAEKYGKEEFPYDMVQDAFIYEVEKEPTVDAVPVVHGTWIDYDEAYSYEEIQCSVCLKAFHGDDLCSVGDNTLLGFPHYCPHCGARMDGEQNED